MSIGALIAYISYLPKLFLIITEISSSNIKFNKQLAEHERVFEYFAIPNEYDIERNQITAKIKGNITFSNVVFKYPNTDNTILENANLNIDAGTYLSGGEKQRIALAMGLLKCC